MADIRLVQPRGTRVWLTMSVLAMLGILVWASAFVFGDPTRPDELPRVGAAADFGAIRAPVLPMESVPVQTLHPLSTRDLGRLVRVSGTAESRVAANSVYIRTPEGYRLLVRFEPEPPPDALRGIGPGSSVSFDGYIQNIARAEFHQLMDSLNVAIPRPRPARKFGDLPDPEFARIDALFIKDHYISVRPEALLPEAPEERIS
jgi:hypothetical protein